MCVCVCARIVFTGLNENLLLEYTSNTVYTYVERTRQVEATWFSLCQLDDGFQQENFAYVLPLYTVFAVISV